MKKICEARSEVLHSRVTISHPTISHPLGNLQVENDDLWEVYSDQRKPYMIAPPVSIVEKLDKNDVDDTVCRYRFRTDNSIDSQWGRLLMGRLPNAHWEPGKPVLEIDCIPANLESQYDRLKSAVAETNAAYAAERKRLIADVRTKHDHNAAAAKAKVERDAIVQRDFDSLEI